MAIRGEVDFSRSVLTRMPLEQGEQDRIWRFHQIHHPGSFSLSYPRLRFLAEQCRPGTRVLNIGVGSGYLEALLVSRRVEVSSLDPSIESIEQLRTTLNMGTRARAG